MRRTTISLAVSDVMAGRRFFWPAVFYAQPRVGMSFNNVSATNLAAFFGAPFAPMAKPPDWYKPNL